MTNCEAEESWLSSGLNVADLFGEDEEPEQQPWFWKLLGLVTAAGTSVAGWAGVILALRYLIR